MFKFFANSIQNEAILCTNSAQTKYFFGSDCDICDKKSFDQNSFYGHEWKDDHTCDNCNEKSFNQLIDMNEKFMIKMTIHSWPLSDVTSVQTCWNSLLIQFSFM